MGNNFLIEEGAIDASGFNDYISENLARLFPIRVIQGNKTNNIEFTTSFILY